MSKRYPKKKEIFPKGKEIFLKGKEIHPKEKEIHPQENEIPVYPKKKASGAIQKDESLADLIVHVEDADSGQLQHSRLAPECGGLLRLCKIVNYIGE